MGIVVENLTKNYGVQKAIDDISFQVNTGEILGFLGPNGAGKTTTMKIITCFMSPTNGDVKVNGLSIRTNPEEVKKMKFRFNSDNSGRFYQYSKDYR